MDLRDVEVFLGGLHKFKTTLTLIIKFRGILNLVKHQGGGWLRRKRSGSRLAPSRSMLASSFCKMFWRKGDSVMLALFFDTEELAGLVGGREFGWDLNQVEHYSSCRFVNNNRRDLTMARFCPINQDHFHIAMKIKTITPCSKD